MKILETQSAHLTNYEVLTHLESMRARYATQAVPPPPPTDSGVPSNPMKSGNLETVMKELTDYLQAPPSPLAPPSPYTPSATIRTLLTNLAPYALTKAELLMILNLRPTSIEVLDTVVEEMEARFADEQVEGILRVVGEVLGGERGGGVDGTGEGEGEGEGDSSQTVEMESQEG
ncbi:MAG: hypothetical protein M1817_001919 [Caeruleum heppii]|nr:MAG: hypothetical protein M1817_001919 [Caeruleum heppii]